MGGYRYCLANINGVVFRVSHPAGMLYVGCSSRHLVVPEYYQYGSILIPLLIPKIHLREGLWKLTLIILNKFNYARWGFLPHRLAGGSTRGHFR